MAQKSELPAEIVNALNAHHERAMQMIGEGSRDPNAYSRMLQDFVDGAHSYHEKPDELFWILETLGVRVERIGDAEARFGEVSQGIAYLLERNRERTIIAILRDINFFVRLAHDARAHRGRIALRLLCEANAGAPIRKKSRLKPRWSPEYTTDGVHTYHWEIVIG